MQIITTTKNERIFFLQNPIPQNVWLGTTVESNMVKHRIDLLRDLEAKVK